jgi:hypothetical protein
MKCYERSGIFAVALPIRAVGRFPMQQRRIARGLGHLQAMLIHLNIPASGLEPRLPRLVRESKTPVRDSQVMAGLVGQLGGGACLFVW